MSMKGGLLMSLLLTLLLATGLTGAQSNTQNPSAAPSASADPFLAIRFFEGEWQGTSEGEPGVGTVRRSYSFILAGRFLHERNTSTYPPSPGKTGEVHEHWSFFSYDRTRKVLVLRQFHQEGFINLYSLQADLGNPKKLVFESESFENFDNRWKARETYDLISADEFLETFELAAPGKTFEVYSKNRFKRVTSP
jgi:hypothetical protein